MCSAAQALKFAGVRQSGGTSGHNVRILSRAGSVCLFFNKAAGIDLRIWKAQGLQNARGTSRRGEKGDMSRGGVHYMHGLLFRYRHRQMRTCLPYLRAIVTQRSCCSCRLSPCGISPWAIPICTPASQTFSHVRRRYLPCVAPLSLLIHWPPPFLFSCRGGGPFRHRTN
jgi:hypothetical protein